MTPEETFLEHLGDIERLCAFICRQSHVTTADEVAEFTQEVTVRLVEDNYSIIRKFEGRSTFRTYLHTVILRLHHQYRIEKWGKWRPSAEARRLGDKAITLERLINRDGLTYAEAVQTLTTPKDSPFTIAELEAFHLRLPIHNPRPMIVSDGDTPETMSPDADASDLIAARERERTARDTCAALDRALITLAPGDRLILQMRYWEELKVPEIARRLQRDQKKIYKQIDKLRAVLRTALVDAGIDQSDVDMLLDGGDQDIHFDDFDAACGKPPSPSLSRSRRGGRRKRRGQT
jgi:RNA polymerase sigma factor for flagellar operon FliA